MLDLLQLANLNLLCLGQLDKVFLSCARYQGLASCSRVFEKAISFGGKGLGAQLGFRRALSTHSVVSFCGIVRSRTAPPHY